MLRTKSKDAARAEAEQTGQPYGLSCIDGMYYVGTREQLGNAGVPDPDWSMYTGDDLNGFMQKACSTSDDYAVWNAILMFSDPERENNRECMVTYLTRRGWQPDTPTALARVPKSANA